ncbi:hypothetical protein RHMOL_Rhmol12G0135700 [Rhododendron molle]|uniref:Uncharacterized protein n=1 Tax=Rhododendron molle TaxID=49168 RepID=A0ACC0LIZ5_RHOML|nr:hypothetical protein RHMOL_Rhmol12G0135700 [Rhododendron molle]
MGIVEAKVRLCNIAHTTGCCFPPQWHSVHNFSVGPVARIFLGWDPSVFSCSVLFSSDQLIVVACKPVDGSIEFVLSIVYGHNNPVDRRLLWNDMRSIAVSIGNKAWIQMGGFNSVRSPSERLVGFDVAAASDFNQCLTDISHEDLPAKGFWFTWTNKRGGSGDNKSRIDRIISNNQWLVSFPNSEATFVAPGISDHCPMLVTVLPYTHKRRPFKFFNFWLNNPGFRDVLIQSWGEPISGRPMYILSSKLKRLKVVLRNFNLQCYSIISRRVCAAKEELDSIQEQFFKTPFALCYVKLRKKLWVNTLRFGWLKNPFLSKNLGLNGWLWGIRIPNFFIKKCVLIGLETLS